MTQKDYDVIEYIIKNKETLKMMMQMANIANPEPILKEHLAHVFSKKDLTYEDISVSMDHVVVKYLLDNYFSGGNSDDKNQVHSEE